MVATGSSTDLDAHRTEVNDLAAKEPQRVQELPKQYDAWAQRCVTRAS